MMVSPKGDYIGGSFGTGWALAGIMEFEDIEMFGGVTFLTKYMEKLVP
jgi:hypothetical protein